MASTTKKSGLTLKHRVGYAMGDLGGCMTFALMAAGIDFSIGAVLCLTGILTAMILQTGIPCIVARGRKGGSNVAAAICNALLYMLDGSRKETVQGRNV